MELNGVQSSQYSQSNATTRKTSGELGKDEFLKILIAQMQNQDPTQPMDNSQFIAQMAQFSALEQMQQLNATFQNSQAYSLLGRSVSAEVTGEDGLPKTVSGVVSGVRNIGGTPYLAIGGDLVSMQAKISVDGQSAEQLLMQGAAMIGKYVTGSTTDSTGAISPVSGVVDRIAIVDGLPVLYIGSQAVKLSDVTGVSAAAPAQAG